MERSECLSDVLNSLKKIIPDTKSIVIVNEHNKIVPIDNIDMRDYRVDKIVVETNEDAVYLRVSSAMDRKRMNIVKAMILAADDVIDNAILTYRAQVENMFRQHEALLYDYYKSHHHTKIPFDEYFDEVLRECKTTFKDKCLHQHFWLKDALQLGKEVK